MAPASPAIGRWAKQTMQDPRDDQPGREISPEEVLVSLREALVALEAAGRQIERILADVSPKQREHPSHTLVLHLEAEMHSIQLWVNGPLLILDGEQKLLTRAEAAFMTALGINAGQVMSYDLLIDHIWQEDFDKGSRHAIHELVRRLRRKLGAPLSSLIKSHAGFGYVWKVRLVTKI